MIFKTRGIVFRFVKFQETSIIVTIFTELFGLQSYMINGVRSKSARNKIALYQPLTLLDLVVYHRENANIERIKEIHCLYPYTTIATDVRKSTIAIFITELLNRTVKDESHAKEIFEFLCDSLRILDAMEDGVENFHLLFIIKLSRYLGFGAHNTNELLGPRVTDEEVEKLLFIMITLDYNDPINITALQRKTILGLLINFYQDHIDNLGEIKSIQVLREVLS